VCINVIFVSAWKPTDKSKPDTCSFPRRRETLVDRCAAAHGHLDGRRHERLVAEALGRPVVGVGGRAGRLGRVVETASDVRDAHEPHHRAALGLLDEIHARVKIGYRQTRQRVLGTLTAGECK